MIRPISDGSISGTGLLDIPSHAIGGVLITTDGTNAATVILREEKSTGKYLFEFGGKEAQFVPVQIQCDNDKLYFSISGTNALAMIYEYVA